MTETMQNEMVVKTNGALVAPGRYDYAQVEDVEIREMMWDNAAHIARSQEQIVHAVRDMGHRLNEVRAKLSTLGQIGTGIFTEWCEAEFPNLTQRALQYAMSTERQFGESDEAWEALSATALRYLSADSVPDCVREEVLEEAQEHFEETGKQMPVKAVKERIQEVYEAMKATMNGMGLGDPSEFESPDDEPEEPVQVVNTAGEKIVGSVRVTWANHRISLGSRRARIDLDIDTILEIADMIRSDVLPSIVIPGDEDDQDQE